MSTTIRKPTAAVSTALVLVLAAAGAARAADATPQPATQFLAADGTPLAEGWRAVPNVPTFVLIHGFQGRGTDEPYLRQAAAVAKRFPAAQVVIADWHLPASGAPAGSLPTVGAWAYVPLLDGIGRLATEYGVAVGATRRVARDIADWMEIHRVDSARTVLCGHSLGAHVAGFVGREISSRAGRPLHAILATDPAGPRFAGRGPDARLADTDALHVIVVHTTKLLGYHGPLGTVDVYVDWPESHAPDLITRHAYARKLVTQSFLSRDMVCSAGRPFGVNALLPNRQTDPARMGRVATFTVPLPAPEPLETSLRVGGATPPGSYGVN